MRVLIIFTFLSFCLSAQQFNPGKLKQISREQNEISRQRKATNDSLSQLLNIPKYLEQPNKDNDLVLGYIENGIPYYYSLHNEQARSTTGVEYFQTGPGEVLGLNGRGVSIGVWDGGTVRDTHVEFERRLLNIVPDGLSNHATHVSGTIGAGGINEIARGMAPKSTLRAFYAFNNDIGPMADEAANGLILSNHSYGLITGWHLNNGEWQWFGSTPDEELRFGWYGNDSRAIDNIAYNAPNYLIVWSAGNDRDDIGDGTRPGDGPYDCIGPEGTAKNNLVVGAITGFFEYEGPESADISGFSSWGPVDDGRIKPDIVGDGVNLFSPASSGDEAYTTLSGTSMSAPNVTGSLALLQQLYDSLHGEYMTSAALKAMAIHTAREAGSHPGPDYTFGWGILNIVDGVKVIMHENDNDTLIIDAVLSEGQMDEYTLLSDGSSEITATIVWTDPPANIGEQGTDELKLLNDLDLRAVSSQATFEPWILDPVRPSAAAKRGDNFRDNVEKIQINEVSPGVYRFTVSHKNTLTNGSQRYALIVTGSSREELSTTKFWIDGESSFQGNTNISSTSGGAPTNVLSSGEYSIVFDQNSGLASDDTISLMEDLTIKSLIWDTPQGGVFDLKGNNLTITQDLLVNADEFLFINGSLTIAGEDTRIIGMNGENVDLTIEVTNAVEIMGSIQVHTINFMQGDLQVNNAEFMLNTLEIAEPVAGEVTNSMIWVQNVNMDRPAAVFSNNTWEISDGTVTNLQVSDSVILGTNVILEGKTIVTHTVIDGNITANGELQTDIFTGKGGAVYASDHSLLIRDELFIDSDGNANLTLSGISSQLPLEITFRKLLCLDNLTLENVNVISDSKVNLIGNSNAANSNNVLQEECENIVFADFELSEFCANSVIDFNNISKGPYNETDIYISGALTLFEDYIIFDEPGDYDVALAISGDFDADTVYKQINVTENQLENISIVEIDAGLVASIFTESYIWLKDGMIIEDFDQRILPFPLESGNYRVSYFTSVPDVNGCQSRVSEAFRVERITSLADDQLVKDINIYPNPLQNELFLSGGDVIQSVTLLTLEGKRIMDLREVDAKQFRLDMSTLDNGVYILRIETETNSYTQKIIKE